MGSDVLKFLNESDRASFASSDVALQLLFGSIEIMSNSQIYKQQSFINAYASTVSIKNSNISEIALSENNIEIISSELELEDIEISRIMNTGGFELILLTTESILTMNNVTLKDSEI